MFCDLVLGCVSGVEFCFSIGFACSSGVGLSCLRFCSITESTVGTSDSVKAEGAAIDWTRHKELDPSVMRGIGCLDIPVASSAKTEPVL